MNNLNIREIAADDIFILKDWKNKYREFFFDKSFIDNARQSKWYEDVYLEDDYNTVYLVESDSVPIGCIGVYEREFECELYNVIRGNDDFRSTGAMSVLLDKIVSSTDKKIVVQVLAKNPAITWYEKNGFIRKQEASESVLLELEK